MTLRAPPARLLMRELALVRPNIRRANPAAIVCHFQLGI